MFEPLAFTIAIFAGTVAMLEGGRRLRRRHNAAGTVVAEGVGTLEAAIFGLFGLLLAFSFSGAVDRFASRRTLIVKEASAIGSAWARLELLPGPERDEQRARFRRYADARLDAYRKLPDVDSFMAGLAVADGIYAEIWSAAVASSVNPKRQVEYGSLLLPSLEAMSDVALERAAAFRNHPPFIIFGMLFGFSLLCSFLAGYTLGDHEGRRAIHRLLFALAVAATVYVTLDLEYPRFGLIRVSDTFLTDLRQSMK